MLIWIEVGVAVVLTAAFVISTLWFKPEHLGDSRRDVRIGAAFQGLIIGGLVGFFIVPLRIAYVQNPWDISELPPPSTSISVLPVLIFLLIVRRGLLARAPLIGRYLRAYRRAALRFEIDGAHRALARMDAMDDKGTSP